MEIVLGDGKVFINTCKQGDRVGIAFTKVEKAHDINTGSFGDVIDEKGEWAPDLVIWIDKIGSGRVLQDVVNGALLMLSGWTID